MIVRLGATNGVYEDTTGFVNAVITARKPAQAPE